MIKKTLMILIPIFILCHSIYVYADKKYVLLASSEYPPYFGKELRSKGMITEIIVKAFSRVNYLVQIKFYPRARALKMGKRGHCDGLFTVCYQKEREKWFVFSDPLPPNEMLIYKRKADDIIFKTVQDLIPFRIGIVRGYVYPLEFQNANHLNKVAVVDDRENLKRLIRKNVDLILIDRKVAEYLVNTYYSDYAAQLEPIEPPVERIYQHLIISREVNDYQQKLDDFNRGLRQIINNGVMNEIIKKHGYHIE